MNKMSRITARKTVACLALRNGGRVGNLVQIEVGQGKVGSCLPVVKTRTDKTQKISTALRKVDVEE